MTKLIGWQIVSGGALLTLYGVAPFWLRLGVGLAVVVTGAGLIGRELWRAYRERQGQPPEIEAQ